LIEYDGEQHFRPVWGNEKFKKIIYNDQKKNEFAELYGYKLIRFSYDEIDLVSALNNKLTIYLKLDNCGKN
jgi:very-short-patch-repair endonuclease